MKRSNIRVLVHVTAVFQPETVANEHTMRKKTQYTRESQ